MGLSQGTWAPTRESPGSPSASWGHSFEIITQVHAARKDPCQNHAEEAGGPALEPGLEAAFLSSLSPP